MGEEGSGDAGWGVKRRSSERWAELHRVTQNATDREDREDRVQGLWCGCVVG